MKTDNPPGTQSDPPDPSQPARGTDSPQLSAPARDRIDEAPDATAAPSENPPRASAPGDTLPGRAQPPLPADGPMFPTIPQSAPAPSLATEGQESDSSAAAFSPSPPRSGGEGRGEEAQSLANPSATRSGRPDFSLADPAPSPSLAAGREAGDRQRAQEEELAALLDGVVRGQERMLGVLNRAVDSLAGFQARLDALESRLRDVDLRHQSIRNSGYGGGQ